MCSRVLSCCLGLQVRGDCSERPERRGDGRGLGPPQAVGRGSYRTKIAGGSAPGVPGGEGTAGRAGRPRRVLRHGVSQPPILFPMQHLAVQASLLCAFHLLLLPALPEGQPRAPAAGELLARSLFACGVSALLQTSLGSRTGNVCSYWGDWEGLGVLSTYPAPRVSSFPPQVSGAVVVSGLTQLALGMSGVCGWAARRCGPMVLAPSLSIIGLSAYKEAAFLCSASWGVALLLMLLTITFSQHLGSCRLPFCARPRAPGGSVEPAVPTLRTLSVLLPFAAVCIHLGNVTCPLSSAAGEWPLLTPRALAVGIAMAVGCSVNSAGCYVLCGRLLRAPRPPQHACNRGLCAEGLGSLLAGLLGAAGGTAASIANTCVWQGGVSALACVALGMSPRLAGLLTRIPLAVHGGVLCVTYAVAVGTGISYFQHADIDSGRNIFIVGFTMFMALLVPRWLGAAPAHLATGWVPLDLLFLSLLTVPVFLTGFLSFFLENTVSGTPEERGLPQKAGAGDGERGEASPVYALPAGLSRLLPSCKAFPCCFLCPGREEEEEEEKEEEDGEDGCRAAEEGVVAAGEGTRLLLKPGTGEAQDREPSQAETLAWHTGA
uniref:Solute carrier family 23 member 3 n=1 Tax=Anser brachyrhynchus TaxID=132585 RepID=A0A8B9D1S5_9AVES